MIHDYKAPEDKQWKYIFFAMCAVYTVMVAWAFYDLGFNDAKWQYSQPSKYRCHESVVYRSTGGYWEKSGQTCKPLEDIK